MQMELAFWFLWISLTISLLYSLTIKRGSCRLPPGPRPLPLIGNLFKVGGKPHRSFAQLAKTYGPVMALKLGQVTTIVVSSPDIAREVLHKQDQAFCSRSVPDAIHTLRHHETSMAWSPVNQIWKNLRRICSTELFMSQKLDANQGLRQQKVRELIAYMRKHCMTGQRVEVGRIVFITTLNLISSTFFSIDMADLNSESGREFRDLIRRLMEEIGSSNLSDFFPVLRVIDPQGRRRRTTANLKTLYEIFDELIDKRLQGMAEAASNPRTSNDFLDALLQFHIQESSSKLDRPTIKALLADLFTAGSDTSASTVEWAMAELLRNPSSMAKARAELIGAIEPGKEVEESDISRLPYLQAIVKETLRLHPPAPFLLPRRVETSVELCGFTIPKYSQVLVNIWAMGRDKNVWTDPELFMPERFLGRDIGFQGRDFELIPFGAGRRICPGLPLAFRIVHLVLASLLRWFDWDLPGETGPRDLDMTEKFGVTLAMAVPLQAVAIPVTC